MAAKMFMSADNTTLVHSNKNSTLLLKTINEGLRKFQHKLVLNEHNNCVQPDEQDGKGIQYQNE